jgi:serine/threonine protein kinase
MSVADAAGRFAAGARVGGYVLEEQIGCGGMAVVFRAADENLGRPVALKILAPALATDAAFRQRFIRESRAAAAVDDPHIIPLYGAGESDGVLFIAMRYVHGGDVRSLLARDGALDAEQVAAIVAPVASALDAAHAAGLIHRDVKPANMLLDVRPGRPDHVYLADFGLSKAAAASTGLTGTGLFIGTVDYAAPEQIDGRPMDGRTDQYALACATFEMLCGQPPFQRDQGLAVIHAHLSTPPPLISALRAGLPAAADAVLTRALAKSPEDRYPTCGEFSDALRAALGVAPYHTRPRQPSHPPTDVAHVPPPAGGPGGWVPGFPGPAAAGPPAQGPPGPAWPPTFPGQPSQQGRRPAARWPYALAAAAVVAPAVAVAIVFTSGPGRTVAGGAGGNSTPGTSASSAPAANGTRQPASSAPAGPGWSAYTDPSGFSVGLPPGWAVDSATRTGTYPGVDFTGPSPGFHLFISWSTRTGTRALPAWQQLAASFARKEPAYRLIQLRQVRYRSYDTAVWEFTNLKGGVPTHVIDLGIVVKPGIEGYAIELYGPQAGWPAIYLSMWKRVLATFQPAP